MRNGPISSSVSYRTESQQHDFQNGRYGTGWFSSPGPVLSYMLRYIVHVAIYRPIRSLLYILTSTRIRAHVTFALAIMWNFTRILFYRHFVKILSLFNNSHYHNHISTHCKCVSDLKLGHISCISASVIFNL